MIAHRRRSAAGFAIAFASRSLACHSGAARLTDQGAPAQTRSMSTSVNKTYLHVVRRAVWLRRIGVRLGVGNR